MASQYILTLTDANFDEQVVQNPGPILVDFWASWCGPCKAIAPDLEALSEEFNGRFRIGKVNVDENSQLVERFTIRNIPTLYVFKNGEQVEKVVGARSRKELKEIIEKFAD